MREIGRGGMGAVWLGRDERLGRDVALKRIGVLPGLGRTDVARAEREAHLAARLHHPHVVAVFDVVADDESDARWLVMEYVDGTDLARVVRERGALTPETVTPVLRQVTDALLAAHSAGIVHRDVKPANILLTEYGVPVLSDFGISTIDDGFPEATRSHRTGRPGTGESSVGMSLPWAAPETLWDDPVSDARSDRYSLAATLYSLLEGRSPHEVPGGPNNAAHLAGRIKSGFVASMKRPDLPPSLQAILRRGLSHDRSARFDSAAEMGRALQDVQRELGYEVTPLEVPRGGELASRPPAVTTRVHQDQPIELPEGHATLAPPSDAVEPMNPSTASSIGTATGSSPWDPPTGQPAAASAPYTPAPAAPLVMAGVPAGARTGPPWRLMIGAMMGVLILACVVVASLLIAKANAGPSYEGRAVDNLQVELTTGGVYQVTIPEGLEIPTDIQVRVLATGTGDAVESATNMSVDSAEWVADSSVTLNPMESENLNRSVYIDADQLAALGIEATTLHQGDILLVAAPVGELANQHPEFGINYSDGTLMILQVIDAY